MGLAEVMGVCHILYLNSPRGKKLSLNVAAFTGTLPFEEGGKCRHCGIQRVCLETARYLLHPQST